MGWWNVEGTDSVIGDAPLDALGVAIARVLDEYQSAFNRKPTKAEWEALLLAALGGDGPDMQVTGDGTPSRITVEIEPDAAERSP